MRGWLGLVEGLGLEGLVLEVLVWVVQGLKHEREREREQNQGQDQQREQEGSCASHPLPTRRGLVLDHDSRSGFFGGRHEREHTARSKLRQRRPKK